MARSRNIKPGFFENEDLGVMDYGAQLLFAGLWTLADREGRLEDRPRLIRGKLFPYRTDADAPIDSWLACLAGKGFIVRYEVDNVRYIQVVNFIEHQNPHKNEVDSVIPPPLAQKLAIVRDSSGVGPKESEPLGLDSLIPVFSDSSNKTLCATADAVSPVAAPPVPEACDDPPVVREALDSAARLSVVPPKPHNQQSATPPTSISKVCEITEWYNREFYPLFPRKSHGKPG